ncbi:MAG: carbonic anhydrase [Planctomycetota bacterium]
MNIKRVGIGAGLALAAALTGSAFALNSASAGQDSRPSTPQEAYTALKAGNMRFVNNMSTHPRMSDERLKETAEGQKPYVSILACADSRKPIERIFDKGVGDLFVVRVAGNVAGPQVTGSIEYGTAVLQTPLLVVMGHSACGAVDAAMGGTPLPGSIPSVIDPIRAAVEDTRDAGTSSSEMLDTAIRMNAFRQVRSLLGSQLIADRVKSGDLMVVAAVYDLGTGEVEFLGEHPKQAQVLGMQ